MLAGAANPKMREREIKAERVMWVDERERVTDFSRSGEISSLPLCKTKVSADPMNMCVEGHPEPRGVKLRPEAEINGVRAADHPAEKERGTFHSAPERGVWEEMRETSMVRECLSRCAYRQTKTSISPH